MSTNAARAPAPPATRASLLARNRWRIARRFSQFGLLALFLLGPLAGIWIVKGNLASSLTFDVLPLTDPLVLLQSLAARHAPAREAIAGAVIVAAFYLLVSGRAFCAWVCPVNLVTDAAAWLRLRLGITAGGHPSRNTRYWLLGGVLVTAALTGTIAWEFVNPVTMMHRGLLYGMGLAWILVAGIFLFDLIIAARGWCGHLCPVGAFYGLLGRFSMFRVAAPARARCDFCMACFRRCPEPQVLWPVLKPAPGASPVIRSGDCTTCGACIDVCPHAVFRMTHRFDRRETAS